MAWTTSQFLTALKRNVTVPNNQIRFSDEDMLSMADEQMLILMLPLITSLRQEYFVRVENVPLVADQAEYKIPYRAVGRTLREIKIVDDTTNPGIIYSPTYVIPEDTQRYLYNRASGDAAGYTVRGDNIVILPTPGTNVALTAQLYYELAPSQLVLPINCGVVSSVDALTGVVTMVSAVDTSAGATTSFATGQTMDLVDYKSGNTVIGLDLVNTNVASNLVTFAAARLPVAPNALKAGDYVCLSQQTPVLQIPNEAFFVLVQGVSSKILEAQGDFEGMQASEMKLKSNVESLKRVLVPRVEADAPTILNTNGLIRNRINRNFLTRYNL